MKTGTCRFDACRLPGKWLVRSAGLAVMLALMAPGQASAEAGAGVERVQEHMQRVAELRESLGSNIDLTTRAIIDFQVHTGTYRMSTINLFFDAIDRDTNAILSMIGRNSDFRDNVDAMRAQFDTQIARNMLEPASARRDARLAQWQELQREYSQNYDNLDALERSLLAGLRTKTQVRGQMLLREQMLLDADADRMAEIVVAMRLVIGELTALQESLGGLASADSAESPALARSFGLIELGSELNALTEGVQRGRAELAPITNAADRLLELSRGADPIDGCPQELRDDLRDAQQQLSGLDLPVLQDRSRLQMQRLVSAVEEVRVAEETAFSGGDTARALFLGGHFNQVIQWERLNSGLGEELGTLVRRQARYLESVTEAQVRCAASEF